MSTTKQETISRVRGLVRAENTDAFLTNRFLYSLVLKYAKLFIKRLDDQNRIGQYNGLYEQLPMKLIEVSAAEASCSNLDTCCTFSRTEEKLPPILYGTFGPIIRTVSSVDLSQNLKKTYSSQYSEMRNTTTFKYNKDKYYWLNNGYAYFPDLSWEEILFDAIWLNSIEEFKCCNDNCCEDRLSEPSHIPDFLFADIEQAVRSELLNLIQIPVDGKTDNQNPIKP